MTSPRYPELDQFLGGYFHEDFASYAPTWEGVVDFYAGETSLMRRQRAVDELDALLAEADEEIAAALEAIYVSYLPDPMTTREWLRAVRDRLALSTGKG
jgi:hypothetical protein